MRKFFSVLAGLAVIVMFAEGLVVATLMAQGRLNNDVVNEIREILRNPQEAKELAAAAKPEVAAKPTVTLDEVLRERSLRVLQIGEREREYQRLQGLVTDSRGAVLKDLDLLTKEKEQFALSEKQRLEREQSESIERMRSILAKSDIQTVADQLLKLPIDENMLLLKGMPEKRVAELLQMMATGDPKQAKRGQEIIQAILNQKSNSSPDPSTAKN